MIRPTYTIDRLHVRSNQKAVSLTGEDARRLLDYITQLEADVTNTRSELDDRDGS